MLITKPLDSFLLDPILSTPSSDATLSLPKTPRMVQLTRESKNAFDRLTPDVNTLNIATTKLAIV